MLRSSHRSAEPTRAARCAPQLVGLRAELERESHFRSTQLGHLVTDEADAVRTADAARVQVVLMLMAAADAALAEADAALDRLQQGDYGSCETCHEPISLERLEVLPASRLCTPCQYRREARRKGGRRASRALDAVSRRTIAGWMR